MDISGTTRLYAIVGDPIRQVGTPATLNPLIRAAGVDAVLVPFHVPAASFDQAMAGIMKLKNLDGIVVTYPFKEQALALVNAPTARARTVGGVNVMRREADGRWVGDMFDGVGLLHAVAAYRNVAASRVLLIGAGGAGRAIGLALAEAGAASMTVVDLNRDRAQVLVETVQRNFPGCRTEQQDTAVAKDHDIIVNATPIGMKPDDGLPAEVGDFSPSMTVVDVVLSAAQTPFLRAAASAGAAIVPGQAMTQGQAKAIFEFLSMNSGSVDSMSWTGTAGGQSGLDPTGGGVQEPVSAAMLRIRQ